MAKCGTKLVWTAPFGRIWPENGIPAQTGMIRTGFGPQNRPKPAKVAASNKIWIKKTWFYTIFYANAWGMYPYFFKFPCNLHQWGSKKQRGPTKPQPPLSQVGRPGGQACSPLAKTDHGGTSLESVSSHSRNWKPWTSAGRPAGGPAGGPARGPNLRLSEVMFFNCFTTKAMLTVSPNG